VINHPWQPLVLKLHILVAPLLTFAIGMVMLSHIWRHLKARMRSGRRSGLLTVLVLGPMIVTGYLIQAITDQGWLKAMAISHIALGLLFGVGLLAHQFAAGGKEARAARAEARRVRRRGRRRRQVHLQRESN
jgi:cobalamin biosynthesis protein CobD/CbiB